MLALHEPCSLLASEFRLLDADRSGVQPANADHASKMIRPK
jgi:hypothetical protein